MRIDRDLLLLDKEEGGGCWLLSYTRPLSTTVHRLRIVVGGPGDWHLFTAEIQTDGQEPAVLGYFEISPAEIQPRDCTDDWGEAWNPFHEPDFLRIPDDEQETFAAMVWTWGRLNCSIVPKYVIKLSAEVLATFATIDTPPQHRTEDDQGCL